VSQKFAGLVVVVAACLLAGPAVASADTLTVNDDAAGPGPSGANCAAAGFTTIQAAINAGTASGDTINVCAGTYNEVLSLGEANVTLRGAQAGVDARNRSGAAESVINLGDATEPGFSIAAGNTTVDGFTITDTPKAAIRVESSAGHSFVNNVISNTALGTFVVGDVGGTDTFRHNFFDGNNRAGPDTGDGIQVSGLYSAHLVVDENRFRNHNATAIQLQKASGGVEATDNTTDGDGSFIVSQNTFGETITGNTILGAVGSAIYFADGNTNSLVANNTIGPLPGGTPPFRGIKVAADFGPTANQNIDIIGNTITGRSEAIRVDNGMHAGVLDVHFNRIAANTVGITDNDTNLANSIDATNNWWGCNAGVGDPDCDTVTGAGSVRTDSDPNLVLGIGAAPGTIAVGGQTSAITAGLTKNSDGATPPGNEFPDATPLAFATSLGSLAPAAAGTSGAQASSTLTSGASAGTANVSATLDNESVTAPVVITGATAQGGSQGGATGGSGTVLGQTVATVASLVGRTFNVKNGAVTIPVKCSLKAANCNGSLTLTTVSKIDTGTLARKKRLLRIGRRSFSIRPGARKKIKIKLSRNGRRLIAKKGRVRIRARLSAKDAAGVARVASSVIRLKGKKRRQR
jgi:hypothetical protein